MGFDLTGYEKDNSVKLSTFLISSILGTITLIVIVLLLSFYFFMVKENVYSNTFLKGGIEDSINQKVKQIRVLNSYGNKNDDGIESTRIPINDAIKKTLSYYND